MPDKQTEPDPTAMLAGLAREVEDFVAGLGWDQPPQLFALVPTDELLAVQPDLAGQVDQTSALTPLAQEPLPRKELGEVLAGIVWPKTVHGCALAQEIVVLPPDADVEVGSVDADGEQLATIASRHPRRREARLVAAVLTGGRGACVLRLRGTDEYPEEIVEHPELAPNLTAALLQTLRDDDDVEGDR